MMEKSFAAWNEFKEIICMVAFALLLSQDNYNKYSIVLCILQIEPRLVEMSVAVSVSIEFHHTVYSSVKLRPSVTRRALHICTAALKRSAEVSVSVVMII